MSNGSLPLKMPMVKITSLEECYFLLFDRDSISKINKNGRIVPISQIFQIASSKAFSYVESLAKAICKRAPSNRQFSKQEFSVLKRWRPT